MPHYNNPHRNMNAQQGMNRHPDYARQKSMNAPRSAAPPELPSVPQYYPGVNPYGAAGSFAQSSALVPYNAADSVLEAAVPAAAAETAASSGLLSNLGNLKGIFDRLGGIDGIMGHVGRVQKIIGGFQQFAPMAKLLMGSFLPGAKAAAGVTTTEPLEEYRPQRRRKSSGSGKRRSSGSGGKRSGGSGSRRSGSSTKRRSSSSRRK